MSLLLSAERAGILTRACEILADATQEATDQISAGAAQIRAYRLWRHNRLHPAYQQRCKR